MRIDKRHIRYGLLSLMAFGLAACANTDDFDGMENPAADESQENTTTPGLSEYDFTFQFEGTEVATRGENGYDGAETGDIGTGKEIDYLVFAIYDGQGNLLDRFAKEENDKFTKAGKTVTAGKGQNILSTDGKKQISYSLASIEPGEYRIVCWAQSISCDAYDTSDLTNVKISYNNNNNNNNNNTNSNLYPNNDESRDAFCASETFTVLETTSPQGREVILRRPFAQINVGTTGADYKNTALTPGGAYYTCSAIEINKVSTSLNVVTGEAGPANESVTFGYSNMPAWYQTDVPAQNAGKIESAGEQFLQIHLNDLKDNSTTAFAKYLTEYPTVVTDDSGNITEYLTETFKYLSMCYVLVPGKTTLDYVKVSFATDQNGTNETYVEVPNLPVNTNWRTNIIGGLYAPKSDTPTQPDDPTPPDVPTPTPPIDDPSSMFNGISTNVFIVTTYNKSDNNYQRDEEEDNGYSEIK